VTAVVSDDSRDRWSTLPEIRSLWAGVLVAPVAWALHLLIAYALSNTACATPGTWVLAAVTGGAFAASLGGGYVAWRMRSSLPHEPEEASDSLGRARFMANGGLILSALFAGAIAAQAIPLALLRPCE
jgi:hypothetical protein